MFKDHFSDRPAEYGRYRPGYPDALFAWLAQRAPGRDLAWDCATGNGQAALGLLPHFRRVLASDASAAQIAAATPAERLEYRVAPAEASGLPERSVDLVTVAQAAHWFDADTFHAELRRVLRPAGVVALWSYNLVRCAAHIDAVLDGFYHDTMGPWWPPERHWVENGYRDLPFPWEELPAPAFAMSADWDLARLIGYLGTWSAVKRCRSATGADPLRPLRDRLAPLWGGGPRSLHWPLALRVGRAPVA
jgi:SAM-dependent methyltransferase